ncbi:hypothetical protein DFR65_101365 [Oceanihabitans sediminis]|uniref:Uncharacterized protein n=1 Tax=Oceanihabitans sediminis TaxID=1812012 RepID=A0A368P5N9_9FLAO|nr:hypothetical protein [Oceanihabitans sediminis]RBP34472.1 hypothetical protein DFR65_101365 [Oceanihabitans sediminis]RCU58142.1 hypothetical protein DU428_01805 [Oceanihabitans sediminis]
MDKQTLKTSSYKLTDYLKEINENPERINKCSTALKKDLLIHIENESFRLLNKINSLLITATDYPYPKEYLPNKEFDYWANTIRVGFFNYNDYLRLEKHISENIQIVKKKKPFQEFFYKNGLEAFDYLDENFTDKDKFPTAKYTLLYIFLNEQKLIKTTAQGYLMFVKQYKEIKPKFSRLNFEHKHDKRYKKFERELTELYNLFSKTQ